MHKRHDVQRQHVVESLDNLIFQLYALSFFLSPNLLPLLFRVSGQFFFYKPRDLDPKLSLRVWLIFICVANAPSFWYHVRDGAADGRTIILDFVGMGFPPSKLHLVLLDTLALCLQILLTIISFEISIRTFSPSNSPSGPIPSTPAVSPPALEIDPSDGENQKYSFHHSPTMIIDLRFRHVINRLRNPIPPASRAEGTLPLPNTTPTPFAIHLRAIVRRREEAGRRALDQSGPAGADSIPSSEDAGRMPGGMSGSE